MHFDTVLTMLDVDKVTVFPEVVKSMVIYSLRPGREETMFSVTREENFISAVTDALEIGDPDVILTGGGTDEASREQWDNGNNIIA